MFGGYCSLRFGFVFFFYGKGGNEINVSWIIQLVLDKMPQDEQN